MIKKKSKLKTSIFSKLYSQKEILYIVIDFYFFLEIIPMSCALLCIHKTHSASKECWKYIIIFSLKLSTSEIFFEMLIFFTRHKHLFFHANFFFGQHFFMVSFLLYHFFIINVRRALSFKISAVFFCSNNILLIWF